MHFYSSLFMAGPLVQDQDQGLGLGKSAGVVDDSPPREGAPLHSDDSHHTLQWEIKAERTYLDYVHGYNLGWWHSILKQAREQEAEHSISTTQVPDQEHGDAELGGLGDDSSCEGAQLHCDDLDGYDGYQHDIEELERELERSWDQKYNQTEPSLHLVDDIYRPTEPIQTEPVYVGQFFIGETERLCNRAQQFNQQFDEIERLCNRTQHFDQQLDEIESLRNLRQHLNEMKRRRNRRQHFSLSNQIRK